MRHWRTRLLAARYNNSTLTKLLELSNKRFRSGVPSSCWEQAVAGLALRASHWRLPKSALVTQGGYDHVPLGPEDPGLDGVGSSEFFAALPTSGYLGFRLLLMVTYGLPNWIIAAACKPEGLESSWIYVIESRESGTSLHKQELLTMP